MLLIVTAKPDATVNKRKAVVPERVIVTPAPPFTAIRLLIINSPLVSVTVLTPTNWITSKSAAVAIACRRLPGPASLPFVTGIIAAFAVKPAVLINSNKKRSIRNGMLLSTCVISGGALR